VQQFCRTSAIAAIEKLFAVWELLMYISTPRRLLGLALDAGVVLAFGCVLIGAGHGVAPIGLLMFLGSPQAWGLPMAVGWAGIGLLVASVLVPLRGHYLPLALGGLGTLVATWWLFITPTRDWWFSLIFSVPFLALLAVRLLQLGFLALCPAPGPIAKE
jgi:hypothetical protein